MTENTIELPPKTMAEAERQRFALQEAMQMERQRHKTSMDILERGYASAVAVSAMLSKQLQMDKLLLAENVMVVQGNFARAGSDRLEQREAAIHDLVNGTPVLRERYIATKDYAHWHGQGVDCEYGYGPKHGDVIFRIGLHEAARERDLTEAEVDACVYYLRTLELFQECNALGHTAAKNLRCAGSVA